MDLDDTDGQRATRPDAGASPARQPTAASRAPSGPLEGLKVIELAGMGALPFGTQKLADRGFVTVSVGFAAVTPARHLAADVFIEAADGELYRAKSNGRNQVMGLGLPSGSGLDSPAVDSEVRL